MLVAVALMLLSGPTAAGAQSVPVTVEVSGPEAPGEPTGDPTGGPTEAPSEPTSPSDAPSPTDTISPPPPGEEPPPAAADPPDDPLARTGTDTLRTLRDAAALIAAGLLLLIATRKPERNAR